ncbi:MAG: hypothetical protein CL845_09750 [Crocinitomicaceae bacterium]|nr:hypothetical protein [Crocinitomicaceae bacterium]
MMHLFINSQQLVSWSLILLIVLPSCSSSILISSYPSEADVFTNGTFVGKTPIRHWDNEPSGSMLDVRMKKDGYEDLTVEIEKKGRVNLRALMCWWMLIPLGWMEKYPAGFYGHLQPVSKEYSPLRVEVQTKEALGSNIFVVALENTPCHGSSNKSVLEASLGIRLMEKFRVLERQALDIVSSEQQRNMTGLHDESSIVDAGKFSGAKGVVMISQLCDERVTLTSLRYVDCESGALHWAVLAENQNMDDIVRELFHHLGS